MTDPTDRPPARTDGPDICQLPDAYGRQVCVRTFGQQPCATCPLHGELPHELRAETTVTGQLDATAAGLDPEQEIRARAAAIVGPPPATNANAMLVWDSAVVTLAAWIRDGSRP